MPLEIRPHLARAIEHAIQVVAQIRLVEHVLHIAQTIRPIPKLLARDRPLAAVRAAANSAAIFVSAGIKVFEEVPALPAAALLLVRARLLLLAAALLIILAGLLAFALALSLTLASLRLRLLQLPAGAFLLISLLLVSSLLALLTGLLATLARARG